MALAVPAMAAEDRKAVQAEWRMLYRELRAAERKALQGDELKELKKAEMEARKAYRKALDEIPEVKEVATKLEELEKQRRELQKQLMEVRKKNADEVADEKKAADDASAALKAALAEVPGIKELYAKQAELKEKMKALRGARKPRAKARKEAQKEGGAAAEKDLGDW
ncbi:MAG: hypothetical protein ACOC8E_01070 [Planctomycetota bacterium]